VTLLASGSTFSTGTSDSFQRVHFYTQIYLVSNNQAANQTTVRVLTVAADNDPNRGGFGTAGWAQYVNSAYVDGGSLSYNFDAGQSYTLYDRSDIVVTHSATGTASSSSYAEFDSNISLIMPQPLVVSTSATLTPYPIISSLTVPSSGSVGTAYTGSIAAHNAVSYSVASGAIPTGLTLNTTTGAITGTPTVPGVFTFTLRATGPTGTGVPTGFSTTTATQTVTILGGGRVWNGTAFVAGTTKVWNGTDFVSSTTKVWNGSDWVSST
jgi:hypothetical protein